MMSDEQLIEIAYAAFLTMAPDDGEEYESYDDLDARQRDALRAMVGAVKAAVMHDVAVVLAAVRQRWTVGDAEWSPSVADHDAALEVVDAIGAAWRLPTTGEGVEKEGLRYAS